MGNSNLLFESIFKRKLSDAGALEYLTQITNEHPFFTPAQFFLLLKTEKDTISYEQQAAKTSLLFNNPYWLQFQLEEHQPVSGEIIDTTPGADLPDNQHAHPAGMETDIPTETIDSIVSNNINDNAATETIAADKEVMPDLDLTPVTEHVLNAVPPENISAAETNPFHQEYNSSPTNTEGADDVNSGTDTAAVSPDPVFKEQFDLTDQIMIEEETIPLINEPIDTTNPVYQNELGTDNEIAGNAEESDNTFVEQNVDTNIDSTHTVHFNNEDSPLINDPDTEETGEETIKEREAEPLRFKLNIDTANTTEDQIIFEPLHTSDYFASLGIKLSGEIMSSDKLGKQLKSFTEWLKTMKKIHGDQLVPPGGQADVSIQKLAEQSNKEAGVVTEAMADVLLHQGKTEKAIEVYKKLSLLNPSKSAYFAAKIDQLKEH